MSRTAVVVEVPAAERLVDEWADVSGVARDPGVPAHVTVLYPFVHPAELPDAVERMRRLCSEMAPFVATLTHVGVFPGAVWLAPEPAESFRGLTTRLVSSFGGLAPYGGAFRQITPHRTVLPGDPAARPDVLRRVPVGLDAELPIEFQAVGLTVLALNDDQAWERYARVPFGSAIPQEVMS